MTKVVIYVCTTCGSEDVSQDAWADWDPASEQMVLRQSFDDSYCHSCESECSVEEQEITDPTRLEFIKLQRRQHRIGCEAMTMFSLVQMMKDRLPEDIIEPVKALLAKVNQEA